MPSYSDLHALAEFLDMGDLKPKTPYIQRGNDMLDRLRCTAQMDSSFPYVVNLPGLKEVLKYFIPYIKSSKPKIKSVKIIFLMLISSEENNKGM